MSRVRRASVAAAFSYLQFGLSMALYRAMARVRAALDEARAARSAGAGTPAPEAAAEMAPALERTLGRLAQIFGIVEGADAAPTLPVAAAAREVLDEAGRQVEAWRNRQAGRPVR